MKLQRIKKTEGVVTTTEIDKAETPETTEAAPTTEVTYQADAAPVVPAEKNNSSDN